jgi:hypothetical protein
MSCLRLFGGIFLDRERAAAKAHRGSKKEGIRFAPKSVGRKTSAWLAFVVCVPGAGGMSIKAPPWKAPLRQWPSRAENALAPCPP